MLARARGFTLVEMLVALFIFSVVSLLLVQGLHTVIGAQQRGEEAAAELREMGRALLLLSQDLEQVLDRPFQAKEEASEAAFIGEPRTLRFSYLGSTGPQRAGYHLEKEQLFRDRWPSVKEASTTPVYHRALVKELRYLSFRYFDKKLSAHTTWPPLDKPEGQSSLPRAVEVQFTFKDGKRLRQLYLLPQEEVEVKHAPS